MSLLRVIFWGVAIFLGTLGFEYVIMEVAKLMPDLLGLAYLWHIKREVRGVRPPTKDEVDRMCGRTDESIVHRH